MTDIDWWTAIAPTLRNVIAEILTGHASYRRLPPEKRKHDTTLVMRYSYERENIHVSPLREVTLDKAFIWCTEIIGIPLIFERRDGRTSGYHHCILEGLEWKMEFAFRILPSALEPIQVDPNQFFFYGKIKQNWGVFHEFWVTGKEAAEDDFTLLKMMLG